MKIAIVEDEMEWQEEIVRKLVHYFDAKDLYCFSSGEAFLKEAVQYEIVFLDIELPESDGLAVARQYKRDYPGSIIIILTSHLEYSREGYRVNAFRYLDKMNLAQEMAEALNSAQKLLQDYGEIRMHVIGSGGTRFLCRDILYLETSNRKLLLHNTEDTYICKGGINDLSECLEDSGFLRVHHSYLVNMRHIERFLSDAVLLDNGEQIMVSTRRYGKVKKQFHKWKFERSMA